MAKYDISLETIRNAMEKGSVRNMRLDEPLFAHTAEFITQVSLDRLHSFPNHPFRVVEDEEFAALVESIRTNGVVNPILVRQIPDSKDFEIVSGHRRSHAAKKIGLTEIPAIVREMDDDEAIIHMCDSNLQRENVLPSEKAFAFKMKMDAMRRQAGRPPKENSRQIVGNYETADIIGKDSGESGRQVQRYIRLTCLIPELLDLVDKKKLQFTVAVEISYIDREIQNWIYEYIQDNGTVKAERITALRKRLETGALEKEGVIALLNDKPNGKRHARKVTFTAKKLNEYFPDTYSAEQIEDVILELLENWKRSH